MAIITRPLNQCMFGEFSFYFKDNKVYGSFSEQSFTMPDKFSVNSAGDFCFSTKVFTLKRCLPDNSVKLLSTLFSGSRFTLLIPIQSRDNVVRLHLKGCFIIVGTGVSALNRLSDDSIIETLYLMTAPKNPVQWVRYLLARYIKPVK